MRSLSELSSLDELMTLPRVLVFKHSTQCPVSAGAHREVEGFEADAGDLPLYKVLVIEERAASNAIEEMTGVPHQSPQVLFLKDGEVGWHASHFQITAEEIRKALT